MIDSVFPFDVRNFFSVLAKPSEMFPFLDLCTGPPGHATGQVLI